MRLNNTQINYFYGDSIFQGGLSALSGAVFTNTIFTSTSALSVINTGIGPALYVAQAAGNYDIASFYDLDGVEVLHVGNAAAAGAIGKIGINTSVPGAELTVNGAISSNNNITVQGGNSDQWNSNYTSFSTNSSNYDSVYTTYKTNSAAYTVVGNVVSTLSANGTFNLYLRNANLATLTNWTSAVSIPANINELTGGGPCIVSDILCIIKSRSLNAGVPTTGNLFSTRPGFALEDNSGNSFCSTATIGKAPVVGAYYRTANVVGTDSNTGRFTYNGGAARVVGATLPVYITTTLTSAVNGTAPTLPVNINGAFSNNGFHVKVDDEIMYVSNVTGGGASMTVLRGQLGTAQAPHDPGATVTTNIATNDMLLVDACFVMKRFDN